MERSVLELSGKNFCFDLDVRMPASRKDEFLSSYKSNGCNNERDDYFTFCTRTMGLKAAERFCKNLPEYAKVSNVMVYPSRDTDVKMIYSGPLMVSEENIGVFLDKRLDTVESRIKNLSKTMKEIRRTPVPLGLLIDIMKKRN
jgi:hypothetical protein